MTKVPVEISDEAASIMPDHVQDLRNLKIRLGEDGLPSDLDIPTSVNDTDRLDSVRDQIFQKTGIYVEFRPLSGVIMIKVSELLRPVLLGNDDGSGSRARGECWSRGVR